MNGRRDKQEGWRSSCGKGKGPPRWAVVQKRLTTGRGMVTNCMGVPEPFIGELLNFLVYDLFSYTDDTTFLY